MLFETPDDIYKSYKKFRRKQEYRRAYRCMEKLLDQFADDELTREMVDFCVFEWKNYELGKRWLNKLVKAGPLWSDVWLFGRLEAELGNLDQARVHLNRARALQKIQPGRRADRSPKRALSDLDAFIRYKEHETASKHASRFSNLSIHPEKQESERTPESRTAGPGREPGEKGTGGSPAAGREARKASAPTSAPPAVTPLPAYSVPVRIEPLREDLISSFVTSGRSSLKEILLYIDYAYLTVQSGFDDLLCLSAMVSVEKYWYQIETAKKVLKQFHGRALLCDEVGLGKTIEAGMIIKEYLMRGMARNVLVLTPAPLVSQWKEEMQAKFGLEFVTTDDGAFAEDPDGFWKKRLIIASLNTAKSAKNMPRAAEPFYDLVVVDEAHHLRNRSTLSWKLVNKLQKKFILLLTATPVQNHLIELFNLITILKPGQFKTEKQFKAEYLRKGNLKDTADKDRLRELLRDVMIRNTRSAIDLKLPKRFAATIRVEPSEIEQDIYARLDGFLRRQDFKKQTIYLLLREAGSSFFALKQTLLAMNGRIGAEDILEGIDGLGEIGKGRALMEILAKNPGEKKVIFTQFIKSMDYIADLLDRHDIPSVMFRGDLPSKAKDAAIEAFKNDVPVLISTESGGEGRNLQFCNTIINFDLPWNPMRIEQRIGRLHRIGQTRDVFIFNLSVKETIEDYIIEILDSKINMFEMVIGEIEPILGHLKEERDFEEIILDLWSKTAGTSGLQDGFARLGKDLIKAKEEYLTAKTAESEIFGEDYEM